MPVIDPATSERNFVPKVTGELDVKLEVPEVAGQMEICAERLKEVEIPSRRAASVFMGGLRAPIAGQSR
jgi:hypothetical protein